MYTKIGLKKEIMPPINHRHKRVCSGGGVGALLVRQLAGIALKQEAGQS
jgi:hypothetical protein